MQTPKKIISSIPLVLILALGNSLRAQGADTTSTSAGLDLAGIKKELAIEKFLTGMPRRFEVASGPAVLSAVLIELDSTVGKAASIQRLRIPD